MTMYRCPLGNVQPSSIDAEKVKRDGWRNNGILVVNREDSRLDWIDREFIDRIGNRLYGERGNHDRS